ncbi:MAG: peptidoglycan-binding domain-containing protein, partial [Planktothrix sp.]
TLGFYEGVITGYFDSLTAVAVQQFQRSQGIPATGVATSTTLVALNVTSVPSTTLPDTILRLGSRGAAVKVLQAQLQTLGYYTGIVDGVFDQSTQRAVINFQRAYGITVRGGEVGPTTASYLVSATTTTQTLQPRPIAIVPNQTIPITNSLSTISLGDTGPEVRKIQRRLRELNYYNGPINGFFDYATQDSLIRFQEYRGVTVNGIAGPTTQNYLFNPQSVSRPATRITAVVATTPPISGASNIQQLQQRLRIQGLYNGPINGVYDGLTQQAVRQARAFYGPNADTVLFGSL